MSLKMTRIIGSIDSVHPMLSRDLKASLLLVRMLDVGEKGTKSLPSLQPWVGPLSSLLCPSARLSVSYPDTLTVRCLCLPPASSLPPFTDIVPHRYLLGGGHGSHAGAGLDLRKLHSRHQELGGGLPGGALLHLGLSRNNSSPL